MRSTKSLPKIAWAALFLSRLVNAQDLPIYVTICDLLRNPQNYQGKMIEVRAEVVPGNRESSPALDGRACALHPTLNEGKYDGLVGLTSSDIYGTELKPGFTWDRKSESLLINLLASLKPNERVVASVVGMFETKDPISRLLLPSRGFDHLGAFPAQILVKEAWAMVTERR